VRSTAAPYTESRLTRSVANERVGFPVVEQPYLFYSGLMYVHCSLCSALSPDTIRLKGLSHEIDFKNVDEN
jgi:hypothetical protein